MKHLYLTTALTLIASPTLADITPEELWLSWQDTNAQFGMGLSAGSQTSEGGVLVLRDVTYTIDSSFFLIEQVFSEMRLEALNDGTVSVSYDTSVTATLSMNIPDAPSPKVTMTGQIEDTAGLVTGTANDYIYVFSIGRMQIIGSADMGEESGVKNTTNTNAISTGLAGRIHYATSEAGMNVDYNFTMENVDSTQNSTNTIGGAEGGFKQFQRTLAQGYSGEISLFMPAASSDFTNGGLIPEGFTMAALLGFEHMSITQKTASSFFNSDVEVDQQDASMALTVNGQNIGFSTNSQNTFLSLNMPQLAPQPYRTDFEDTAFAFSVPYRASDTPQESSLALRLGGVTVSDNIWALADPENTLSRAPADFEIAAKFSSTLLLDWTNIEAVEAWDSAPTLLHNITLDTFLLAYENAQLEGAGTVDFSNETDIPEPNGGALSFTLTGIPALLERLGGLPLVDPAIIAQANGVLGIFTSAGEGDTLVSEIEFGEGGSISVNGLQVK